MKRYDLIVIGAGPAGLSAAIQAASMGVETAVFDENARPGGQLFKQIHKFFGSKEHKAKMRGFRIGQELLAETEKLGVNVHLHAVVMGLYDNHEIMVNENGRDEHYKADAIIVAAGARENMIPFEGWTVPGVMGAGAAQTLMNLHGVQPGKRVLMVGSGNVGLVVSFQLLQAGVEVAAIIDAAPRVGGYGVHASKLARIGVPFKLSHTVVKAEGTDHVTGAIIADVDGHFKPVPGTEEHIDCDTICLAVGLSPMSQLMEMVGGNMHEKGGTVPNISKDYETSIPGIFTAGDVAGIEEASSAMITGKIAGTAAACYLGYIDEQQKEKEEEKLRASLAALHEGMFSPANKGRNDLTVTDEGVLLSQNLLHKGFLEADEIERFPGFEEKAGIHPVIECTQNIPCNPCQDACHFNCIVVGKHITDLPKVNQNATCVGCGNCVVSCPGQAIFLVNNHYDENSASVSLPYEFLPYPQKGEKGVALGRDGKEVCEAEVISCKLNNNADHTAILTIKVPRNMANFARFYRSKGVQQ